MQNTIKYMNDHPIWCDYSKEISLLNKNSFKLPKLIKDK